MKISISNIAWDKEEDAAVASLLNKYGVNAIDIAPGKYFPDILTTSHEQIELVKSWWSQRGITITGMQSLLFGTQGFNIFDDEDTRQKMLAHLTAICRIAAGTGATKLVFGSPKNRDRKQLSDAQVEKIAVSFFRELGNIAQYFGVVICLEPNPTHYGANFMTTALETACVVKAVNHAHIRMQLDTGAISLNKEKISTLLKEYQALIGHIHISEPNLVPPTAKNGMHEILSSQLKKNLPEMYVTIEMLTDKKNRLNTIEQTLKFISAQYGEMQ
ncbi:MULTISPECIES: sugar phosphate isomerase/epimerase family protein [Erwinia]|uniref:Sugar phosphate isomerase/epimerase family protein n=2 Tax=Erwinia TaxID=551 RepID=A0ABV4E852_9GAMM|nr:sugar phosphate isomerase/epimerase [Erwinia sp. PsM31]MDN4626186.1 sugar phosphate isomerase/epimerase [Erwinia sp. PsM31]